MRRELPLCALLAALVLAIYWPAASHEFIFYDDDRYVTENAQVKAGLTWPTFKWALTAEVAGNWHPVTMLSHALDCELFGLDAGAHHLVNVAFHLANTILLFLLLNRMTARPSLSTINSQLSTFFISALWALHPLRVESVAWVAERKDVLSGFFFLLALLAYTGYVRTKEWEERTSNVQGPGSEVPSSKFQVSGSEAAEVQSSKFKVQSSKLVSPDGSRITHHASRSSHSLTHSPTIWYSTALLFFALGLMSKPMLVTLPFILLLLDCWPFSRFQSSAFKVQRSKFASLLREKLPFFALSAAGSLITLLVQHHAGTTSMIANLSLKDRVSNALMSYQQYLGKIFWPTRLSVFYPHPGAGAWPAWQVLGAAILLIAITALLCTKFKVQSPQPTERSRGAHLDAAAGSATEPREASGVRGIPALSTPLDPTRSAGMPRNFQLSTFNFQLSMAVGWLWFLSMLVPVIGLVQVGGQAMADRYTYLPSIGLVMAVVWALAETSNFKLQTSKKLQTSNLNVQEPGWSLKFGAFLKFGVWSLMFLALCASAFQTRHQLGYWQNTATLFERAAQIAPNSPTIQLSLGLGLDNAGQPDLAMVHYRATLALAPNEPKAHFNLAQLLQQREQWPESAEHYRAVLRVEPTNAIAHFGLGVDCLRLGRTKEAATEMAETLRLNPNPPPAPLNDLAWQLATNAEAENRDGARAVQFAERACELTGYKVTLMVGTLGAAYAEAGRFAEAVSTAELACKLASEAGDQSLLEKNQRLLELYRARRPYRER